MIVRRMEGHHCNAVEERARPCSCGAPTPCHHDIVVVMVDCHGNVVVLGCSCHSTAVVLADHHGQVWWVELFSGHFCMFGGSQFLPRGESSARRSYRLDESK